MPKHDPAPPPGFDKRRVFLRVGGSRTGADYVLYWMQAVRRAESNLALDEAIRIANDLGLPVVVYEGLRPDYPEANARIHTFIVEGMRENCATASGRRLRYVANVASVDSLDRDALVRLSKRAAVVVTDEMPGFIFPSQTAALARRIDCPLVTVDASTIVPMRELPKKEFAARTIRPRIHRLLPAYFAPFVSPEVSVDGAGVYVDIDETDVASREVNDIVAAAGVDASVDPSPWYRGGRRAGRERLGRFIERGLGHYGEGRRDLDFESTSRLSAYLHFGFVSPLEVALLVRDAGAGPENTESFLEQVIVRRELAFNFVFHEPNYTSVEALPDWARKTLQKHAADPRDDVSAADIEAGTTYDDVWNVPQRELLLTGEIHNQPRMLWGKKIFEWSPTPQDAVDTMIRLHYRYALDGRSPLTYTSILWILGLHDRAWGPERPIYGTVRYMTSDSFRRKFDVKGYRERVDRITGLSG
ncbi:MAG: deoxyribodipyrimidine photolyase [Blastocatellia bacterium]|nr:deoxyribodipyrimidine photolyase [Blastocatellia bacterium]